MTLGRRAGSGRGGQAKPGERERSAAISTHTPTVLFCDYSYPLDGEGNSVAPLGWIVNEAIEDTSCDELADDEAHVGVRGQVDTERHGQDLGCVGRSNSCKDTPW